MVPPAALCISRILPSKPRTSARSTAAGVVVEVPVSTALWSADSLSKASLLISTTPPWSVCCVMVTTGASLDSPEKK